MALSDCLEKIRIEQDIADYMLDQSNELLDGGMDQLSADRQVIAEMFNDIESTLAQIESQLKINRDGSKKEIKPDIERLNEILGIPEKEQLKPQFVETTKEDVSQFKGTKEEFIKKYTGSGLITKQSGRWGTIHYYIKKIGDYQNAENKTFDGEDQALSWFYDNELKKEQKQGEMFAGEALEKKPEGPEPRKLFNFRKGDLVKNIITDKEYEVVEQAKGNGINVRLREKGSKQIENFNAKKVMWIPVQKEIKVKGKKKGPVTFKPDSDYGRALSKTPDNFEESVMQFFIAGGRVSTSDFIRYMGFAPFGKEGYLWAVKGKADGTGEKGVRFDGIIEKLPNSFGFEDKGSMSVENEVARILKKYHSRNAMVTEILYRTGQKLEQEIAPEDIIDQMDDATPENVENIVPKTVDNLLDKILASKETLSIFTSGRYTNENGDIDWNKLKDLAESNPDHFTYFPFNLNEAEFNNLKELLNDTARQREISQRLKSSNPIEGRGEGNIIRPGTPGDQEGGRGATEEAAKPVGEIPIEPYIKEWFKPVPESNNGAVVLPLVGKNFPLRGHFKDVKEAQKASKAEGWEDLWIIPKNDLKVAQTDPNVIKAVKESDNYENYRVIVLDVGDVWIQVKNKKQEPKRLEFAGQMLEWPKEGIQTEIKYEEPTGPAEKKTEEKKVDERTLNNILATMRDKSIKNLSDAEIERVFKDAVMPNKLSALAKELRDNGTIKESDVIIRETPRVKTDENGISLLYETNEEYIQETLDGYESEKQKQEAIDKAVEATESQHLSPGRGTGSPLYPKVKSRTVLEGFKESGYVDFIGQKITSPQDIADLWSIHRSPNIEKAHAIFVKDDVIVGTTTTTLNRVGMSLFPKPPVILDLYNKFGADGVYYLHNHPSGNHKPSSGDIVMTVNHHRILAPMGVNILGHVIIDNDKLSVIDVKERPVDLENITYSNDLTPYIENDVKEYEYKNPVPKLFAEREKIPSEFSQQRMMEIAKALLTGSDYKGAIIYMSSDLSIAAYDVFPEGADEDDVINLAKDGIKNNLGRSLIFVQNGYHKLQMRELPPETLDLIDVKKGEPMWYYEGNAKTLKESDMTILWENKNYYGRLLERINTQFNNELDQFIGGKLKVGHIFEIGNTDAILQSAGLPDLPIQLVSSRLRSKSIQEEHPFDLNEVKDLPKAIQDPLAVFRSATQPGSYVILTEIEHKGQNFIAAIETNREFRNISINSIRSVHYKNASSVIGWINDNLATYIDKKRTIEWLNKQRSNSADVKQQFNRIANIINKFENPNISTGNIIEEPKKPYRFAGEYLAKEPSTPLETAAQRYKEKEAGRTGRETIQGIREYIQDLNLPVRRFEEEVLKRGGKQDNNSKPYRDQSLAFGRQEKIYKDYFEIKMKPILQSVANIKKAGMPGEEVLPYIISKHAIERNAVMRGRELREWVENNQDATPDEIDAKQEEIKDKDYSGVMPFDQDKNGNPIAGYTNPDELARDIVAEFESKVDKKLIDDLWTNVKTATSAILDTWESGNQISPTQKQEYLEQFRFYVPLRGWREGDAKQLMFTKGEGFSRSFKEAEGRKSLADNPLSYILSVEFQAIAEQVDNEVKTSMLNLIIKNLGNNEIHELATIKKLYYVKIKHANGVIEWEPTTDRPSPEMFASGDAKIKIYHEHERLVTPRNAREKEVYVLKPGGDMIMIFKGKNLTVAQALNKQNYMYRSIWGHLLNLFIKSGSNTGTDARRWDEAFSGMGRLNNILKATYTSWNIVFPFTNFMRDFQEATITQHIKSGTGLKVVRGYKGAFPAIIRRMTGKTNMNNEMDRHLEDFFNIGGATGYTHLKTIQEIEKDVNNAIKRMVNEGTLTGSISNFGNTILTVIENWNKLFEDATRFSVYLSSLAAGNTKEDAGSDAKEASVNFNRKGKGSKAWDSWFAFFNVALQSMQKNFKLGKDWPINFVKVAFSFLILGFLEALMNALTDDPDDPDSSYYNINPYMRENYLLIPNLPKLLTKGTKGDKYLSIPLPQFWRGFKSMGAIAFNVATKRMTVKDGIIHALSNFGNSLLPVDVGGFWKTGEFSWAPIAPTVIKPVIEVFENRNYMGYSIKNEPFTREQKKYLANAGLGKNNVSPAAKFFTDLLFRWGGGEGKYKYYYDEEQGRNRKVPGFMDINPSTLEHLFKGYTGGTGGVLSDLITTVSQAVDPDKDIDFRNVPFVNKFIRKIPEAKWQTISKYYSLRDDENIASVLMKSEIKKAKETGDWSKANAIYGNDYLMQYAEIFKYHEKELDNATKEKKFDLITGSDNAIKIMQQCINDIEKLKKEFHKK